MIFNVTFLLFFLFLQFETPQNFKTLERLLDEEFFIIKSVKLLFHLFVKRLSVLNKQSK